MPYFRRCRHRKCTVSMRTKRGCRTFEKTGVRTTGKKEKVSGRCTLIEARTKQPPTRHFLAALEKKHEAHGTLFSLVHRPASKQKQLGRRLARFTRLCFLVFISAARHRDHEIKRKSFCALLFTNLLFVWLLCFFFCAPATIWSGKL